MVHIVTRDEWGARPPKARATIATPTPELWLHHTAGSHAGVAGMRAIQDFHLDVRGWWDIAYSYVIDAASLTIYEGRGAGARGGHTFGRNSVSHGIVVMGNFQTLRPTDALLAFIAEFVAAGHALGWWPATLTGGHRDVRPTACPGALLYAAIPRINQLAVAIGSGTTPEDPTMEQALVRRIEEAAASLGYTIDIDGQLEERTTAAVENMAEGVTKLLAAKTALEAEVAALAARPALTPDQAAKVELADSIIATVDLLRG